MMRVGWGSLLQAESGEELRGWSEADWLCLAASGASSVLQGMWPPPGLHCLDIAAGSPSEPGASSQPHHNALTS